MTFNATYLSPFQDRAVIYIFGSYLKLSSHVWRSMYVQQQEDEKFVENDAKIKIKKKQMSIKKLGHEDYQ